jgi:sugar O-acyltransferase (sialic acid O-acetyltransferase NeuD family)
MFKKKYNLVFVGASGFARELLEWVPLTLNYNVNGLLSNNKNDLNNFDIPYNIIADPLEYTPKENDRFVMAVADCELKDKLSSILISKGAVFITAIHQKAELGKSVKIDIGTIICSGCKLTTNVKVGKFVTINFDCSLAHDSIVGDFSTLSPKVAVNGGVNIGEKVFIGSLASLAPRIKIANNTKISASSAVFKDVKEKAMLLGVPAQKYPLI